MTYLHVFSLQLVFLIQNHILKVYHLNCSIVFPCIQIPPFSQSPDDAPLGCFHISNVTDMACIHIYAVSYWAHVWGFLQGLCLEVEFLTHRLWAMSPFLDMHRVFWWGDINFTPSACLMLLFLYLLGPTWYCWTLRSWQLGYVWNSASQFWLTAIVGERLSACLLDFEFFSSINYPLR